MTPNIQTFDIVLGANEVRSFAATGQYFAVPSASAPFQVSFDGGGFVNIRAGMGLPTSEPYKNLIFKDTSGGGCVISFFVGDRGVTYTPPSITTVVTNASTYSKATGILALADGAPSAVYNGLDGAHARKLFIVSNLSANLLYVQDVANAIGVGVPANQSVVIETNGKLYVKNIAGSGASSYCVMEIFYS